MCGMLCGVCPTLVPGLSGRPHFPESLGTEVGDFLVVVSNLPRSRGNAIIISIFCEGFIYSRRSKNTQKYWH